MGTNKAEEKMTREQFIMKYLGNSTNNFIAKNITPDYSIGSLPWDKDVKVSVLRPCLWFAEGQEVTYRELLKYYTVEGVHSLYIHNYLKL